MVASGGREFSLSAVFHSDTETVIDHTKNNVFFIIRNRRSMHDPTGHSRQIGTPWKK
jgi:hypothetical protein